MPLSNGKVINERKSENGNRKTFLGHADSAKRQIWQSQIALRWINKVVAS